MALTRPVTGRHYSASTGELMAWFPTDADCLDYLEWLRWPEGFVCPRCGHHGGWRLGDGRFWCARCDGRSSVTAGTIFDRTRTPLTVWFMACWLFATQKDGVSTLSLQRTLEIGSYQTAWAMLHRLRSVLVRPGRERLSGTIEVDETFMGGEEPELTGGRAKGKKTLVGVAVELKEPKGYGQCRMAPLADASAVSLRAFLGDHVEPGATVITDGWMGYHGIGELGYVHDRRSQRAARARGEDPGVLLPGVHRVASLAKRWLLGTHQGSVDETHLPNYLAEFVFRFNRRTSRNRGLVRRADVPRLSFFYGIAIYLYYEDHLPPHIHARYGGDEAKVDIATGEIIEGSLPRRASRLVAEWVGEHADELAACWEKATSGEEPGTIEPLQ